MNPDEARETLRARREELTARLAQIEDQLDDPVPPDWDDAATEDDEVLQSLGKAEEGELRRIDAALAFAARCPTAPAAPPASARAGA